MPLTLETVLGNTKFVDENSLLYIEVEGFRDPKRPNKPTITANFARNVSSGYVIAEVPENLGQLLLDTVAKEEYENAWLYTQGIKEWNEEEKRKLEAYELAEMQREEDAKKAPLELILDGFRKSGMPIAGMISTYRQKGLLYPNQTSILLKLLKVRGYDDPDFLLDMKKIFDGKPMGNENETWKILTEQFDVRIPASDEPQPQIELKQVPPLLEELESVVLAAYRGQPLEEINVTQQAWADAQISPVAVCDKVKESVRYLNDTHILVKVFGSSQEEGTLALAELVNRPPKQLRSYFRKAADVAYDGYVLLSFLVYVAQQYVLTHKKYSQEVKAMEQKEMGFINRFVFEKLLGKDSILIARFFPQISDVDEERRKKYESIAEDVISSSENGILNLRNQLKYDGKDGREVVTEPINLIKMVEVVRYLSELIPPELYQLVGIRGDIYMDKKQATMDKEQETIDEERKNGRKTHAQALMKRLGPVLVEGTGQWEFPVKYNSTLVHILAMYNLFHNNSGVDTGVVK